MPLSDANSVLPSADELTEYQVRLVSRGVQVSPESAEVYIWPRPVNTAATSLTPSADEATVFHVGGLSRSVQITPESIEV